MCLCILCLEPISAMYTEILRKRTGQPYEYIIRIKHTTGGYNSPSCIGAYSLTKEYLIRYPTCTDYHLQHEAQLSFRKCKYSPIPEDTVLYDG